MEKTTLPRRTMIKAGLGGLLAMGLWPGRRLHASAHAHSQARTEAGDSSGTESSFRFIVVNDTHYVSKECAPWMRGMVSSMNKHADIAFGLHLGDVTDTGAQADLEAMAVVLKEAKFVFHTQPGNHDYLTGTNRAAYDTVFPGSTNYAFKHAGWQFVGCDTTQGQAYEKTRIQPPTLEWLDAHLPELDPALPTVIFTHFPLVSPAKYVPLNSEDLLGRFLKFNLVAAFSGHYHAFTEGKTQRATLVTNRCCSRARSNHDGTKEKGYWLCKAANGTIQREFVAYSGPEAA